MGTSEGLCRVYVDFYGSGTIGWVEKGPIR